MNCTAQLHPSSRPAPTVAIAFSIALAAALVVAGGPSPARAEVSADINIRLGSRPAPVVVFDEEPEVVLVPRSRVYYVEHRGYDLYPYGRHWSNHHRRLRFRAPRLGPGVRLCSRCARGPC